MLNIKYKALVQCNFQIEVEAENIEFAKEDIEMDTVRYLINLEREESVQRIQVTDIKEL